MRTVNEQAAVDVDQVASIMTTCLPPTYICVFSMHVYGVSVPAHGIWTEYQLFGPRNGTDFQRHGRFRIDRTNCELDRHAWATCTPTLIPGLERGLNALRDLLPAPVFPPPAEIWFCGACEQADAILHAANGMDLFSAIDISLLMDLIRLCVCIPCFPHPCSSSRPSPASRRRLCLSLLIASLNGARV